MSEPEKISSEVHVVSAEAGTIVMVVSNFELIDALQPGKKFYAEFTAKPVDDGGEVESPEEEN